jgi:hypothetical protein
VTSLGPLGGVVHTPVINHPEVAIVGPNKIIDRPVVRNGAVTVRKMMNLSSSFDHRIVDGYDAAEFIQKIKGCWSILRRCSWMSSSSSSAHPRESGDPGFSFCAGVERKHLDPRFRGGERE